MSEIKIYEHREEVCNIWTHLAGAFLIPFALLLLLHHAKGGMAVFACSLYGFSLFVMYLGSGLYHAAVKPERRAILRRFDHAAIYFLISGTYTPLMLLCVGGTSGAVVLTISWLIAVTGMTLELLAIKPFKGFSLIMYLISGWLCISVIHTLYRQLTTAGILYLLAGGIVYSLGVVFYVRKQVYSHAIWHLFVIAGSALHFMAVLSILRNPAS